MNINIKRTGIHFLKAFFVSIVISVLLILLLAFILYKGNLSGSVEDILVVIVYLAACFSGGFLFGKQEGKRRFLWGAAFGGIYFLVLLALSMVLRSGQEPIWQATELSSKIRVLLICVLGGMAGGMLS